MSNQGEGLQARNALQEDDKVQVNHVEFAQAVLSNRRNAVGVNVDQIRQMASAILVLDHQRHDLEEKLVTMMAAEPAQVIEPPAEQEPVRKTVYVPILGNVEEAVNSHIDKIVTAYQVLEAQRYGPDESTAIRNLQKAAEELGRYATSQLKKRK
jgi:hypothetical protein